MRKLRPGIVVADGEAGGGHDAADVEGRLADALAHVAHHRDDIGGNQCGSRDEDKEVEPHLFILDSGAPIAKK